MSIFVLRAIPCIQHHEPHFSNRNNWLRATVLGANDGLISTASLLMGLRQRKWTVTPLLLTGWPRWLLAQLVWQRANMSPSLRKPTPKKPTWQRSLWTWAQFRPRAKRTDAYLCSARLNACYGTWCCGSTHFAHNAPRSACTRWNWTYRHRVRQSLQAAVASALSFTGALLPVLCIWLLPKQYLVGGLGTVTLIGLAFWAGYRRIWGCQNFPCHCAGSHLGHCRVGYHQPYRWNVWGKNRLVNHFYRIIYRQFYHYHLQNQFFLIR